MKDSNNKLKEQNKAKRGAVWGREVGGVGQKLTVFI